MSKLDELIHEYCPDGVHYEELQTIFDVKNGYTPSKNNNEYWTKGTVPWFRMEDLRKNGRVLSDSIQHVSESAVKKGTLFPGYSIVMSTTATIGEHALITVPFLMNQQMTAFSIKSDKKNMVDIKFFFYVCYSIGEWCRKNINTSSLAIVSTGQLKKFRIPIPPLEVQKEIVSNLDKFTQFEVELSRELDARRKQYEYYRNQLLTFDKSRSDVEWLTLDKIAKNLDSKRKPVTRDARTSGEIPYYGASGIVDYVKDYIFDGNYLLVSEDGANLLARSTPIAFSISGKTWVNNHAHVLEFGEYATRRLVEIYLNSIDLRPYVTGSAQPKLNKANLNKIIIPIPSLDEQKRVVSVLDKFDNFVTSMSEGLPAEIEARHRQYEYYRNKLLTFQELPA